MVVDWKGKKLSNYLTVIKFSHVEPKNGRYWIVQCSCGSESLLPSSELKQKIPSSKCKSCANSDKAKNSLQDLSGKKFGRWKVLKLDSTDSGVKYLCECKCGTRKLVRADGLRDNRSQSCGCLQRELTSKKFKGVNHWCWNPNLTDKDRKNRKERRSYRNNKYNLWRNDVFLRDNFTCQVCWGYGKLVAHHLNGWNLYIDKRYDVSNGITLCDFCHNDFHDEYGRGHNTFDQFYEFFLDRLEEGE